MVEDKVKRSGDWPETIPVDGDWLETISEDDDWLEAFIRDTEENRMLRAPARLQGDTLAKVQQIRSSKRVQLISYSLKVCTAAAAALFILFTTPVYLQHSVYPDILTDGPPSHRTGGRADLTPYGMIGEGMAKTRQDLEEGFQEITETIYDLSNELFPGR